MEKAYSINQAGVYAIQNWIDSNIDNNPRLFDLWANGIASEIDRDIHLDDDLNRNGEFTFELTGYRDAQGHIMRIGLELSHFDEVA